MSSNMLSEAEYRLDVALLDDGSEQFVIVDRDGRLHEASGWLQFLTNIPRSPNTVKAYGMRVAWYLSWTAQTTDWRSITISHLALWHRTVANSPVAKTNGELTMRSKATVSLWMIPVRSFYEWADAEGLLATDVVSRMTQIKYFAPGSPGGGEHGRRRRVLAEELQPVRRDAEKEPEWIDDAGARQRLETLSLNCRDRFLVDLMYYTGIRAGEALSLFTGDMHLAGGSPDLGCNDADPHFHVRVDNPVENDARAKGAARLLWVTEDLVERYIDYTLERNRVLGDSDRSPHVFVNLYTPGKNLGKAMTYSGARKLITRCGVRIDYALSGPHLLRHTLATRLVRGIDCEAQPLDVVQSILGHASITSTRIYTHDLEAAKKIALASIAPRRIDLGRSE